MMTRLFNTIFSTDSLPIFGGAAGAVGGNELLSPLPQFEVIVSTVILAAIGAVVGYLVKLLLDWAIKRNKDNKDKIEYR